MQIILLSGGSGKRLWPLSNDVRSKQFLQLFKNTDGEYESMVQRVYRQISGTINAGVTIATSKTQVSAIRHQLKDKVSVCIEPCRRDTFPAIALAAVFLKYEKGVGEEECVAVCPVDPYVDDSYYETVGSLEKVVDTNPDGLTLMGIEPTYPSEKYGYIIPEGKDKVSGVKEFKEKPTEEVAKGYIKQGALWNAGVFAFKLGYLLKIAHNLITFDDYRDLYKKYSELQKISFDYAVVEKEKNIKVVRYCGEWKDVGTWNTMSEVMANDVKGNVITDDACENTQVINELEIPVVCMGCKDMIIAVSGDGVLVSDKERSSYIKPYVEKVEVETRVAEKSWGEYIVIDVRPGSMVVKIMLSKGNAMTYHAHEHRDEVWTITKGSGTATIDGIEQNVSVGDVVSIAAGCKHTLRAETDMEVVEVQIGEDISKEDKIKYTL